MARSAHVIETEVFTIGMKIDENTVWPELTFIPLDNTCHDKACTCSGTIDPFGFSGGSYGRKQAS